MTITSSIRTYLDELSAQIWNVPDDTINEIVRALIPRLVEGNRMYICGNGGSASTALHFAEDLSIVAFRDTGQPIRAMSLVDSCAITCIANDQSYDDVFSQQVACWAEPGDILFILSGSGNSRNCLRAASLARQYDCLVVSLTGFDGGKLKDLSHICLVVDSTDMQQIEDCHLSICHVLFREIRDRIKREKYEEMPDGG